MKNIILQHWNGELPPYHEECRQTVENYAEQVGADYRFLTGKPLGEAYSDCAQKFYMLNEEFDEYDTVIMLDVDVIATPWAQNVFDHEGTLSFNHTDVFSDVKKVYGDLYKLDRSVYSAVLIKLTKEQRLEWRSLWDDELFLEKLGDEHQDEALLHYLVAKGTKVHPTDYVPAPFGEEIARIAPIYASLLHFPGRHKTQLEYFLEAVKEPNANMNAAFYRVHNN